jgi:hypothetical protein
VGVRAVSRATELPGRGLECLTGPSDSDSTLQRHLHHQSIGNFTRNSVPSPMTLSTPTDPPCACTMDRTINSPRPVLFSAFVGRVRARL